MCCFREGLEMKELDCLRCVCEFPASSLREVVDDPGGKVRISSPKAMLLSLTYNLWLIIFYSCCFCSFRLCPLDTMLTLPFSLLKYIS